MKEKEKTKKSSGMKLKKHKLEHGAHKAIGSYEGRTLKMDTGKKRKR